MANTVGSGSHASAEIRQTEKLFCVTDLLADWK